MRSQPLDQPPQGAGFERDATGGRREFLPGDMDEHRAAASGDPRPGVVADLDDEVVERIRAPKPVRGASLGARRPACCSAGRRGLRTSRRCGRMRRTGSPVRGRGMRSARHHNRRSTKVPRGVPPSPSRLLALIPPRPSATGRANGPAISQPSGPFGPAWHGPVECRQQHRFRIVVVRRLLFCARMLYFAPCRRATPGGATEFNAQQPKNPDR